MSEVAVNPPSLPSAFPAADGEPQSLPQEPKRKHEEESDDEDRFANISCDTIRRKINMFLGKNEMTQTEFLKTIRVNSNSFQRFMKQKGPLGGSSNGTFFGAARFFDEREKAEKEEKQQAKKTKAGDSADASAKSSKLSKTDAETFLTHVMSVPIPSENIYDDCDEIRSKISHFLGNRGVTQALFLRTLGVNSNSMGRFMSTRGKDQGAGNKLYAEAYYFFERLRILEGEPKSAKRIKAEKELVNGYSTETPSRYQWMPAQQRVYPR